MTMQNGTQSPDRRSVGSIDIPEMVTSRQRERFGSTALAVKERPLSEPRAVPGSDNRSSERTAKQNRIKPKKSFFQGWLPRKDAGERKQNVEAKKLYGLFKKVVLSPPLQWKFLQKKPKKARTGPTPVGEQLLKGVLLAAVLIVGQSLFHYPGLTMGRTREVKLEPPFRLTTSLDPLKVELENVRKAKTIQPGCFAINLDTGAYVDYHGQQAYSAASMIKVPILVSFLDAVDRGKCKMDDELEIRQDLITNGSGYLQWKPVGTKVTAKKAAQLMIVVSDNTATNLLIDLLGGPEVLNKDFHRWGLKRTKVNHLLADLEGTNTTCPYDMVYLLGRVDHGELISKENREFMYEVMSHCKNRSLLPQGLGSGATIIHKTGTIGAMVGDAGIVTTPGGTRYAVAVQVSRKRNDSSGSTVIREMSKLIYDTYAAQPPPEPKEQPAPKRSTP